MLFQIWLTFEAITTVSSIVATSYCMGLTIRTYLRTQKLLASHNVPQSISNRPLIILVVMWLICIAIQGWLLYVILSG